MPIKQFSVARDDSVYQAFPDISLTRNGKLVVVYLESAHHLDRGQTRIMQVISEDRGRSWSTPRQLTAEIRPDLALNCPRISTLSDGRLVAVVDSFSRADVARGYHWTASEQLVSLWLSNDDGVSWSAPVATPIHGIVPDQLIELREGAHAGRWIVSTHTQLPGEAIWRVRCWLSDDQGRSWSVPHTIAAAEGLQLCEASVLELPGGELVCFMRENSGMGLDMYKALSLDGGITWSDPIRMPIPAAHRPVSGLLNSGRVLITYRFMHGGKGWLGWWTQNFFAALTDVESCLARERNDAQARLMPIAYDRSPAADLGYSGWVQFADGEIYIVTYIVDDAPTAQIRGFALSEADFGGLY